MVLILFSVKLMIVIPILMTATLVHETNVHKPWYDKD